MTRAGLVCLMLGTALGLTGCIGAGRNSELTALTEHFPTVTGIDLLGREITVPADLDGERRFVVSAYRREQQTNVDTWIAQWDRIAQRAPGIVFCELPVIDQGSALFRWWVNNGMRMGITGDDRRRAVVTVYTDVSAFLAAIGADANDTVHVFVLDAEGRIAARTQGDFSDAKLDALLPPAP